MVNPIKGKRLQGSPRGFGLIEVVIVLALLAVIVVFLQVLASSTQLTARAKENTLLLQLARQQLEVIQQSPFQSNPANYPVLTALPEGFSIQVSGADTGTTYIYPTPVGTSLTNVVQKITVQVSGDFTTLTLQGYKVSP